MNSGRIGSEVAVFAVVCVLTIFLFPAVQGPYSAVNGPVTALQSSRAALRLRIAIQQAAFWSLGALLMCPTIFSQIVPSSSIWTASSWSETTSILRCWSSSLPVVRVSVVRNRWPPSQADTCCA